MAKRFSRCHEVLFFVLQKCYRNTFFICIWAVIKPGSCDHFTSSKNRALYLARRKDRIFFILSGNKTEANVVLVHLEMLRELRSADKILQELQLIRFTTFDTPPNRNCTLSAFSKYCFYFAINCHGTAASD